MCIRDRDKGFNTPMSREMKWLPVLYSWSESFHVPMCPPLSNWQAWYWSPWQYSVALSSMVQEIQKHLWLVQLVQSCRKYINSIIHQCCGSLFSKTDSNTYHIWCVNCCRGWITLNFVALNLSFDPVIPRVQLLATSSTAGLSGSTRRKDVILVPPYLKSVRSTKWRS